MNCFARVLAALNPETRTEPSLPKTATYKPEYRLQHSLEVIALSRGAKAVTSQDSPSIDMDFMEKGALEVSTHAKVMIKGGRGGGGWGSGVFC